MTVENTVAGRVGAINLLSRHIRETKSLIEISVENVCNSFDGTARLSQLNFERTTNFLGQQDERTLKDSGANLEVLIASSERVLHHLLDRLDGACEKSRSAIQRLNQIDERIGKITHQLEQINDITMANRILAVNARIQAAQLGEQGKGFGVVADELRTQASRSNEFSSSISTLIDQLRDAVALSKEDLLETASHDREAVEESKREVVRTHGDFRKFLDRTHEFLTEAAADSEKVTSEIHGSVRGLQFQDRASQRLDFIANELDRINLEMATEFQVEAGSGQGHPVLTDMMTRTSMEEQRTAQTCPIAASSGDVELF